MSLIQRIFKFNFIIFLIVRPHDVKLSSISEIHTSDEDLNYRKLYAAEMLSFMNQTADPCDNFYEYACGNFKNVISDRYGQLPRSNLVGVYIKLIHFVEELLSRSTYDDLLPEYSSYLKVAKDFHRNCLNAQLLSLQKSQDYLSILKNIGGFPAIDASWKSDDFNWINMSAHMSNYNLPSLVAEVFMLGYPYGIQFPLPSFGFEIDLHYDNFAENSKVQQLTANRMKDLLQLYGVAQDHIPKITKDIFEFLQIALNITQEINEDFEYCLTLNERIKDSEEKEFGRKWSAYYEITHLNGTLVRSCNYFWLKLNEVIEENNEAVANYLSLKFLHGMHAKLESKEEQKDFCTVTVWKAMRLLIDNVYMKLKFNDEIREDIKPIFHEIRQQLRNSIENADWSNDVLNSQQLKKETLLKEVIGRYEDKNMADRLINELKNLTFSEYISFERNLLNLRKFRKYALRFHNFNVNELGNSSLGLTALIGMQMLAGFYKDFVFIMAGILLPPLYHKSWPNALKYGALGYIVAHEYMHRFEEFNNAKNCFADHYHKYFDYETKRYVNGNKTLNENIADNGGLRLALLAYRKKIEKVSSDSKAKSKLNEVEQMPGINLTPEQLFFLGFSQLYCSSPKLKDQWRQISDEHTPDKYRVLGALTNSADFSRAYSCKVGTHMNPSQDKCTLW